MPYANPRVVGHVISQCRGLLHLPEEEVSHSVVTSRMQRLKRVALKVFQDEVPLGKELNHTTITIPIEVCDIVKAVHLTHVVIILDVSAYHPGSLNTGDDGVMFAKPRLPCA